MTVESLETRRMKKFSQNGEATFLLCPCDKEMPESMLPILIHDAEGCFISLLICPSCDKEINVINGRPQI